MMPTRLRCGMWIFLLHVTLFGWVNASLADERAIHIIPTSERKPAPDFLLANLQGGNSGLADYNNKLVLLNFWATWCIPCRQEMPSMEALWNKYRAQGLVVIAIAMDEGPAQRVSLFQQKLNLSFPILLAPNDETGSVYEVSGLPASYLIDHEGKIISRIIGSLDWASPEIDRVIAQFL